MKVQEITIPDYQRMLNKAGENTSFLQHLWQMMTEVSQLYRYERPIDFDYEYMDHEEEE